MDGMIFAAGLGTRLRPLTNNTPKALVEFNGLPLLQYVIESMRLVGIKRIVINVHHLSEKIKEFIDSYDSGNAEILISDETDKLLDTGGGLLKASHLFTKDQSVLVCNVDIFSEIDLEDLIKFHQTKKNYATLVVKDLSEGRVFCFGDDNYLKGWRNTITGEVRSSSKDFDRAHNKGFCGVQILSPDFIKNISLKGKFSIIDEYLLQAKTYNIVKYDYYGKFIDLGTLERLKEAESIMEKKI